METTTIWREIDGDLLAAALREAFGVNCDDGYNLPGCDTQDVSENLVRAVVEHLDEADLGCDHSVGICCCSALATLHELRLWLDHKRTCPECGGEGAKFVGFKTVVYEGETIEIDDYETCPTTVPLP